MHQHIVMLAFALLQVPTGELSAPEQAPWRTLLHESQANWTEPALESARADLAANTSRVLHELVDALSDATHIDGNGEESTHYTVCGNALTLLENLTHVRIDAQGRDWIGFRTHDHRSCEPSLQEIEAPWRAWLAVRAGLPVDQWFWGLSYTQIQPVLGLLTSAPEDWKPAALEHACTLGARVYPCLIDKLMDDEFSASERITDRTNQLLRRLTNKDAGKLERFELLSFDPKDPMRERATYLNRASMQLVQQRWVSLLIH